MKIMNKCLEMNIFIEKEHDNPLLPQKTGQLKEKKMEKEMLTKQKPRKTRQILLPKE